MANGKKRSLKSSDQKHSGPYRNPYLHDIEPSWTGPHVSSDNESTGSKRVRHWLRHADTKSSPVTEGDFTENINWRIFRILAEFVEGFEFISRLKNEVSIFGSTRMSQDDPFYQEAQRLGSLCAKAGYTIVTGGGPGAMEAGNRGAFEVGGNSVGLNISLPLEQRRNPYLNHYMGFHYFFTRKVMLSASAQAYVFMPGGFGTLDELFEIVTLIQTGKMSDRVPVILIGRTFWHPMISWLERMVYGDHRFVDQIDLSILQVVDKAEEAFKIIKKTQERVL